MRTKEACVLHVAGAGDRETFETLRRTTQVIANVGLDQLLLILDQGPGTDPLGSPALGAEVRRLRCSAPSILGRITALQSEFEKVSKERELHAVHLHGVGPCLLGSRALKGSALPSRVLYSPHLGYCASPWTSVLGRLLQRHLEWLHCAAVTASLTEAETLSRLLNRSAHVLPPPVSGVFFETARQEGARPRVLADGSGAQAVDVVTRLSVLLNGREARVPISWLGIADARACTQLDAANVDVLALQDEAERAQSLSCASAFIHISHGNRFPHAVAQAMAAGVPCLVSDTPPHRTLIRHGETGFICTSERDVLEKLIVLLRDWAERKRIGEAARAEAGRCFTLRHFERAILRAYGFAAGKAMQAAHISTPLPSAVSSIH